MTKYKNSEGYSDPSAGKALANVERDRRRGQRLELIQTREDYERLCCQFRKMANAVGFKFPGQIWLVYENTGDYFKNG